jgi:hypothetical protein
MDIDQHVNQIVQNIVAQITSTVQSQVAEQIDAKITEIIANLDTTSILADQLSQKLDAKIGQLPIDTKSIETELKKRVSTLGDNLASVIQSKSLEIASESIARQVNSVDFDLLCQTTLLDAIREAKLNFPAGSIPAASVKTVELKLHGGQIQGGIIESFGSTGIDDKATSCQLTIMDDVTVVENNLLTRDLTVKGTTTIEGDLNVTGTIPVTSPMYISIVNAATNNVRTSLDATVFAGYSDTVFKQIKEKGLDLNKITLNGLDIVDGNNLSPSITYSGLQKLGVLSELQVSGESLLAQTFYTANKRVGINTLEPTQVLSIWDQEIEIGFGKLEAGVGSIGTSRNHSLVLTTNGKQNIVLKPDGSIQTNKISIGAVTLYSSLNPPANNEPKGTVVFNANPTLGGPLGWISLGDAKWANFGYID